MRIKRRIIAAMLALLIGTGPCGLANGIKYQDIESHWAKEMILKLDELGIVHGVPGGNYDPDRYINADEFIKLIVTSLGYTLPNGSEYWASEYIDKATQLGIADKNDIAEYDKPISRENMAKLISKALGNSESSGEADIKASIKDYNEIDENIRDYVLMVAGAGIINCYEDSTFRPQNNLTRAEAATVITRFVEKIKETGLPDAMCIYVSPDGDDANDGEIDTPFKTIGAAKDAVKKIKSSGGIPDGGIKVYLRGGTYYEYEGYVFDESDSGSDGKVIEYTAYPGEKVTVSGQIPIETSWFEVASKSDSNKLVDKNAASKLLVADLKAHGINDYGEMTTRGYHFFNKGRYAAVELIVNSENQTIARYPNDSTISIPKDDVDTDNLAFTYSDERISKWKNAKDAYIVGATSINYENNAFPIEKIDTSKKKLYISEGRMGTYYTNGWFYGENIMEEIDREGEYYIDRESGKLYYYAPDDFKSGGYTVGLSTLTKPVFDFNGAHHIKISNLTLDGGRGYAILGTSAGCKIPSFTEFLKDQGFAEDDAMFDRSTKNQVYIKEHEKYTDAQIFPGHVWDGFNDDGVGINNISVTNCNVFNFGSGGIIIKGNDIHIENNHIKNIGGVGLYLKGGDLETLEPSGNTILNNNIHRVGYWHKAYFPAIAMHGVAIHVAYNDIYDAPHCIFNYHGNDHIIEYNKIHDAVKECLDMDAIYTRNEYMPQWRGNIIRNNYIYNLGIYPVGEYTQQLNVCGIRTDNYGHGQQIYNNVFANIGTDKANNVIGVTAQGTRNTLKGNIFVDCSATYVGCGAYDPEKKWDMDNPVEKERVELAEKYASNPVFGNKYPELALFGEEHYKSIATNVFDQNLVVNIKFPLSKTNGEVNPMGTRGAPELILGSDNYVTDEDPGFVDYANGDYMLRADSTVFEKIQGFENIDMSKIGNNAPIGPQ